MIECTESPTRENKGKFVEGYREVFGAKVHYVQIGEGPPLILVDGWLGNWEAFSRVLPTLAQAHRCTAIDLPGFGDSEPFPEERHTVETDSQAVVSLMDQLGIGKAGIIGDSFGALVALNLGANQSERFDWLVLQGTPQFPKIMRRIVKNIQVNHGSHVPTKLLGDVLGKPVLTGAYGLLNPEFVGLTDRERTERVKRLAGSSPRVAWESFSDMVGFDLAGTASKVRKPTLVIEGARKTLISSADTLRNIEGCRLEIIPGASHTVLLKKPEEFARAVLEFSRSFAAETR